MSLWQRITSVFKDNPAPQPPPSVLDDFVAHGLQKLMDDVIYGFDNTFATRNQLIDFVAEVLDGLRPAVKREKGDTVNPKKIGKIRLKPLTIPQDSNKVPLA